MYRRFGSEVTIIETASHRAQHEDEYVSTAIREILQQKASTIRLNATCIAFSRRGDQILAHVDCVSGDREISGSHLLLAVGRRPKYG
jgi:pyruvate/2-oxoglutarate dehydrogenase complex dihydrolipoamide dehydrogenase (E3) component